ncbi:permease [Pseudomonas cichorii]|uniref:permease n=1 Tax=Pseudomonas cichorii TaxID=36746 RepID=UPI000E3D3E8D|nr:permease [Pseudomonas cichorii]
MNNIAACRTAQNKIFSSDSTVMAWSIKTIDCPPKELIKFQVSVIAGVLSLFLYFIWLMWDALTESVGLFIGFACATVAYFVYLIVLVIRQKTIFNYRITYRVGSVEHFRHYPSFAGPLFKGIAIFTILLFLGVALVTGSLLFLIGPAAISLGAARSLLNWENKIHHEESLPWNEHNFVTVDRKRSMIITHRTDITVGFEARFPNKDLFEQYLQFLHSVLSPTAKFMEKDWEW